MSRHHQDTDDQQADYIDHHVSDNRASAVQDEQSAGRSPLQRDAVSEPITSNLNPHSPPYTPIAAARASDSIGITEFSDLALGLPQTTSFRLHANTVGDTAQRFGRSSCHQ
jgi:hypothetical protein